MFKLIKELMNLRKSIEEKTKELNRLEKDINNRENIINNIKQLKAIISLLNNLIFFPFKLIITSIVIVNNTPNISSKYPIGLNILINQS